MDERELAREAVRRYEEAVQVTHEYEAIVAKYGVNSFYARALHPAIAEAFDRYDELRSFDPANQWPPPSNSVSST